MSRSVPKQKYFPLTGGLDQITSPVKVEPGKLLAVKNYEQGLLGGYTRIEGYERYDGQSLASATSYWVLNFDTGNGDAAPQDDAYAIGQTSGATGKVYLTMIDSGTFAGGDAAGHVILYNVSGTFQDDEVISYTGGDPAFDTGFSNGFS